MLDFLCISTTGWDEIWGSRQQIMLRLAEAGHRVLFVERQVGLEHAIRYPQYRGKNFPNFISQSPQEVRRNLWRWQPPRVIPGRYYSQALNRMGQARLASQIHPIMKLLGFKSPILWLYPPHSQPLLGRFQERLSIYHCIDKFSGDQMGVKKRVMTQQESQLLAQVDLVFTHSEGLRNAYSHLTRSPIELLASATDVEHFQREVEIHPQMAWIDRPRLVVMGTLDPRVDFHLLNGIATCQPGWRLVLIGQLKNPPREAVTLLQLPNVHYLGQQPYATLPSLLKGADIGLIPYRLNEMTRYINPLKAYEYLASGIPVISTDLPELRPLAQWISIISPEPPQLQGKTSMIVEAIDETLKTETAQKKSQRRMFAQSQSWDKRIAQVMEVIWPRL